MTLEEAIATLRAGKKIRHSSWTPPYYVYIKNDKIISYSISQDYDFLNINYKELDGWEIVAEKKTYYVNIYRKNNNIWTHLYFDKKYADEEKDFLIKQLSFELDE